jgi:hypothetical protein
MLDGQHKGMNREVTKEDIDGDELPEVQLNIVERDRYNLANESLLILEDEDMETYREAIEEDIDKAELQEDLLNVLKRDFCNIANEKDF